MKGIKNVKELIANDPYGMWLYRGIVSATGKEEFVVEYADTCSPAIHEVRYASLEEAIGDMVNYILNPDMVYAIEELPDALQKSYKLAGAATEENPIHPDINFATGTFLYYVLMGEAETALSKI